MSIMSPVVLTSEVKASRPSPATSAQAPYDRFVAARREMLGAYLAWLAENPPDFVMVQSEAEGTASAMMQLMALRERARGR